MKHSSKLYGLVLIAVTLPALAATNLCGQGQPQSQSPGPARSRVEEMLEWWNHIGNKLIAMAKDFPEDKYDFKVQKDERTFAENLLHIAAVDYDVAGKVSKSHLGPDFGKDKHNPSREVYRTKAEVVKLLEEAVAAGATVIQDQGDAGLDKTMEFGWETGKHVVRNSYAWMSAIEHSAEHFGQLVVYYRANNLVPPESRHNVQQSQVPAPHVVDLKAPDGAVLKATYFAATKPGPGVLLFHQSNRTRKAWDDVAARLAAAGINTLTLDIRGFGESGGGPYEKLTGAETAHERKDVWPGDIDVAWQYLVSQPGVKRDVIGLGGAGFDGVDSSVQTARRHTPDVKSLALLSGETFLPGLQFLRQASELPEMFVVADDDEYPPTAEAMELLFSMSSNQGKKFVRYAGKGAPWLGDENKTGVPATGRHGTDLFTVHPELPGIIVDWFVTTLIETPGHAPVDNSSASAVPCAPIINQLQTPEGVAQVTQQLMEAQRRDPQAQLWPEYVVSILGYDHLRVGETKAAVEIMKLNFLAYPQSANASDSLSDVYLADGQNDLARQYAEKALVLVASDTSVSKEWRDVIRDSAQNKLKKLAAAR
jgi:dienelactone hydrolase